MSAPETAAAIPPADPAAPVAAADAAVMVPLLKKYLGRVVPAVLDCEPEPFLAALADSENDAAFSAFATDSTSFSLVVHKHSVVPPETDDDIFTFELQAKQPATSDADRVVSSLAFVKLAPELDAARSLSTQLQTVQINDTTPFETLLSYVRYCFLPYSRSASTAGAASSGAAPGSAAGAAVGAAAPAGVSDASARKEKVELTRNVARKLAELESELVRFSRTVEVVTCSLEPHKAVTAYLASLPAGARPNADDVPDQSDPVLLNALQNDVNQWRRSIRAVTQQDRDPSAGTALQEVQFWVAKERAVEAVYDQLETPGVQLTFEILAKNKRFMATSNFRPDAGLAEAKEQDRVHVFADFVRDLPVSRVTAATSVADLTAAVEACFHHLRQIRRVDFPPSRALELAHALSRDVVAQVRRLLVEERVCALPYEAFTRIVEPFFAVFTGFDSQTELFAKELQDISRKRGLGWDEAHMSQRARSYELLSRLHKRLRVLTQLRLEHHRLLTVVTTTLATEPLVQGEILRKLDDAAIVLRETDVMLDVSDASGADAFADAQQTYTTRLDRVEADLEAKVHAFLARAQDDSAELFRVCERFNALFSRPRIGAAIRGYQDHLLATVKEDLEELQARFRSAKPLAEAVHTASLRDIPPVAAQVVWLKQLGRQLDLYTSRVESVLGPRWAQHPEGQKILKQADHLRARLNISSVFEEWVKGALSLRASLTDSEIVFALVDPSAPSLARGAGTGVVTVNFDQRLVPLFKEARLLGKLVGRVPYDIIELARESKAKFSAAMQLREALQIYHRTAEASRTNAKLTLLVAQAQRSVQTLLVDNAHVRWDSGRLPGIVSSIAQRALEFEEQARDLSDKIAKIDELLVMLKTQKPSLQLFKSALAQAQTVVDAIDKSLPPGYINMVKWVDSLNVAFEEAFADRMRSVLVKWARALPRQFVDPSTLPYGEEDSDEEQDNNADDDDEDSRKVKDALTKADLAFAAPVKHSLEVRQQSFVVEPPLSFAVLKMRAELDRWLSLLADLPHLQCFAHSSMLDASTLAQRTFSSVFPHLAPEDVARCLGAIVDLTARAEAYTQQWLGFQALWDLDIPKIAADMGSDLPRWERLLVDLRKSGGNIEGPSQVTFGPIVIRVDTIQTKIAGKFEAVRRDFLTRLVALLSGSLQKLYNEIAAGRKELEEMNFDMSSTMEIIKFVTGLQTLTEKLGTWQEQADAGKRVETLIQRQRFVLPDDWFPADRVLQELALFVQIHASRMAKLREDAPRIQARIADEELALDGRVKEAQKDWKEQRPVQADVDHAVVVHVLALFDGRLGQLEEFVQMLNSAKKALSMPPSSVLDEDTRIVAAVREEMTGLRSVWDVLAVYWQSMDRVGEWKIKDAVPLEIRKALNDVLDKVNTLPVDMRGYSAYEHTRTVVKNRAASYALVADCCTPFLRPKHQRQILKDIGFPQKQWAELTVGDLWTRDKDAVLKHVRAVLEQAQGEAALEEFINEELTGKWSETQFETFEYQKGKCPLVRNWEPLFEQVASNLSDLSAMKQSPFFAAFEREALRWESFLNNAQALLDVFIEVQRRWVYLEGIFNNSTDVQVQLQVQYRKFKAFDRDFIQGMRDIKAAPRVDKWVTEDKALTERLNRDLETLNLIQKALGEYLETQRQAFPRFYFVGDEDLLEIVGNAKNPAKLMRHMVKMFAGIASLTIDDEAGRLTEMISREGEVVPFKAPIELAKFTSVQALLAQVELEMRSTLCLLLQDALGLTLGAGADPAEYFEWIDQYPSQIALLATQAQWSELVDNTLEARKPLVPILTEIERRLLWLADRILLPDVRPDARRKYEQLITELVYQRDTLRLLIDDKVTSRTDFKWLSQPRFYFTKVSSPLTTESVMTSLEVRMSRAVFHYGFEYLGITEKLVQTPLTTRAYLTLAEALHMRMGGNPFGPAGTGKTETVKALGSLLGRFVLVFNCDEAFDLQAMGRIFVGLCQCGAWGCFDEFNRLQERILSAVSQQILTIQTGLQEQSSEINLLGKSVRLDKQVGLFVTMNPGYAGRSNLPDNLKQLFRSLAMIQPNTVLISQVMLYAQGFRTAEALSSKIVLLFKLCSDQLSSQSHYDFGLRALKSVLRSAGALKRTAMAASAAAAAADPECEEKSAATDPSERASMADDGEEELKILVRALCTSLVPKLVQPDVALFSTLLTAVFPTARVAPPDAAALRQAIVATAASVEHRLRPESAWVDKLLQLRQVLTMSHGVILVGPPGAGKSKGWNVLKLALQEVEGEKISSYVLDPKAITKEGLFGKLDNTTMEWTDGIFTHLLRKILDNQHGEMSRQHWIVFDGDVDPEWAENLNSVLDDNKLLTLPNGERLALTDNIRILFECQNLIHATPATVSRCGMVWFSEQVVPPLALAWSKLAELAVGPIPGVAPAVVARWKTLREKAVRSVAPHLVSSYGLNDLTALNEMYAARGSVAPGAAPASGAAAATTSVDASLLNHDAPLDGSSFVLRSLEWALQQHPIMDLSKEGFLCAFLSLLQAGLVRLIEYSEAHESFPLEDRQIDEYMTRALIFATIWGFGGAMNLADRNKYVSELPSFATGASSSLIFPDDNVSLIDADAILNGSSGASSWGSYQDRVVVPELDPQTLLNANHVIDTADTYKHTDVISAWIAARQSVLLCGPPGSGKSMTLSAVMRAQANVELVTLNFSSTTSPQLLLRTLALNTVTERTPQGLVMKPAQRGLWLVIFCDEINLPAADKYDTQAVVTLMRQMIEHGGFWDPAELIWVRLENIQIIGACNPPTDAGRVALSPRFLRHCPLLFVDFPSPQSLEVIYGAFTKALLKLASPGVRQLHGPLTQAMVDVYLRAQETYTPDQQAHYVYSPRELSRWVRALYEAFSGFHKQGITGGIEDADALVRLWAHEALRLFQDRLVTQDERDKMDDIVNEVAYKHFPTISKEALQRPILYSDWLSHSYAPVGQAELRDYVKHRLRTFYEEELDVKLVLFDEVLEHILRIDRILKQPLGHALLVGTSGSGKTILSRFVAWMNNMQACQIKVHKNYTSTDFDKDLRSMLIRAGCKNIKICFIFDESNAVSTAFLERMNCLLASGEVPGLFEGPDYQALMQECKEAARRDNWSAESQANEGELYKTFIGFVQRNLHVVFTMNPANDDFDNRAATSPALFNRCVIDWMGEWSASALFQVGSEFTESLDFAACAAYANADAGAELYTEDDLREAVVQNLVNVHESVHAACKKLAKVQQGRTTYVTPRHYLDLISQYRKMFKAKQEQLREQQRHLTTGLRKLTETQEQVLELQTQLREKDIQLLEKEKKANEQLEQMMAGRKEAEAKQKDAEALEAQIKEKAVVIDGRKHEVQTSLDKAMPAVLEAKSAVSGINKTDLDQVTRYNNPPALVKMTMEAVCAIMGVKTKEWADMKPFMRKPDFIKSVISYDMDALPNKVRAMIEKEYIPRPEFVFEQVNKSSSACGPLVLWVRSLMTYSTIKESVGPLSAELASLEEQQSKLQAQLDDLRTLQAELNEKIESYREQYAVLIGEAQTIKAEMEDTKKKVTRSVALLGNLGIERERWESDQTGYNGQLATVLGDCILAAGFLAYIGYFNQTYRSMLFSSWKSCLERYRVPTSANFNVVDYMSTPQDRLSWAANALPSDDLSMENGIILGNFHRYPLIVDPSGQATAFLMKHYAQRKIIRTSFLDANFLKNLESALRFGNALLCEDVENIDPVLNSVLNHEITRTGGRVMVTVGDKAIDLSPSFVIFLATRNPLAHFTPDLCSRVTLVNFSVTPASLAAQCLTRVLQVERPEVDKKRTDLMKIQSEFRVRLRTLEDGLLDALNAVEGNILDDEKVLGSLEHLKKEAAETKKKLDDSEQVMLELAAASEEYRPFATACSSIYFTLERLSNAHFLYQFSLSFFFSIVSRVLNCPGFVSKATALPAPAELSPTMRLASIDERLFSSATLSSLTPTTAGGSNEGAGSRSIAQLVAPLVALTFSRVSRALLNDDRVVVALRLAQVLLEALDARIAPGPDAPKMGVSSDPDVLDFVLRGRLSAKTKEKLAGAGGADASGSAAAALVSQAGALGLGAQALEGLTQLCSVPAFAQLSSHMTRNVTSWAAFITPEAHASDDVPAPAKPPSGWEVGAAAGGDAATLPRLVAQTALCRAMRPDLVPQLLRETVEEVLGEAFLAQGAGGVSSTEDLDALVSSEASAHIPVLLVSQPGFDPSTRVDALAAAKLRQLGSSFGYTALAMGSPEGYEQADLAINAAAKKGHWVLLRNVHMAPEWLGLLEKRLHRMTPHANFRLFLSAELHPKLPSSLLRQSALVLYESPKGVKASLLKTLGAGGVLTKERVEAGPVERARLHFLLAWLHAVIVERRRYSPIGWLKPFEFNENDQSCAHAVVDGWITDMSHGRHNIPPSQIPWPALCTVLAQVVYGGRVDNAFDGARLSALVQHLFTPAAYEHGFALCTRTLNGVSSTLLTAPEGNSLEAFRTWAQQLPDDLSPEVLGLPANAEKLLLVASGATMCSHLLELQDLEGGDESTAADSDSKAAAGAEDDDSADSASGSASDGPAGRPAWVLALETSAREWSGKLETRLQSVQLPAALAASDADEVLAVSTEFSVKMQHPVFRCLYREWGLCRALVSLVRRDLTRCLSVLRGDSRADGAFTKDVLSALQVDQLPLPWRTFTGLRTLSLGGVSPALFVANVGARWVQLARLVSTFFTQPDCAATAASLPAVWLGGLFSPEAFVAATRQAAAHALKVSLESLELAVDVQTAADAAAAGKTPVPAGTFTFTGFVLHGAMLAPGNELNLGPNELDVNLEAVRFAWNRIVPGEEAKDAGGISVPAFMDGSRAVYVLSLPLRAVANAPPAEMWSQRSVCVTVADPSHVPAAFA